MARASREFQVFAKPAGPLCNLACRYCYYLPKERLFLDARSLRMPEEILEDYIAQHIEASPGPTVNFSWHGGEPTIAGLDYFRRIVDLQRKHRRPDRRIANGIQTNGTLLDDDWGRFLAAEGFTVGLSLDGPPELHDRYRVTRSLRPTHAEAMRGYALLQRHRVPCDILCVVHAGNAPHPARVYRFFKAIGARTVEFLPLVEPQPTRADGVSPRSVPALAWGSFLCAVFDEWMARDIGRVTVRIFAEAARTAFGQAPALCVFRETCGDVPVIEHNGELFACDHFVDAEHRLGNIRETPLVELLESPALRAFGRAKADTLPRQCRTCEVRALCQGGCPKDRILRTPDGEEGLNYLCAGYMRFFTHCRPFLAELSAVWRRQTAAEPLAIPPAGALQPGPRPGRNDPCPCGSGRKYKHCCLGK
jgi:uncharacterized protein